LTIKSAQHTEAAISRQPSVVSRSRFLRLRFQPSAFNFELLLPSRSAYASPPVHIPGQGEHW
jgi:hypothetical protein